MFLDGVSEGWGPDPSCCSAESKEFLECMSWVGRRSAKKFVDRDQQKWDWGWKKSWESRKPTFYTILLVM